METQTIPSAIYEQLKKLTLDVHKAQGSYKQIDVVLGGADKLEKIGFVVIEGTEDHGYMKAEMVRLIPQQYYFFEEFNDAVNLPRSNVAVVEKPHSG